jgi:hypothetical protein
MNKTYDDDEAKYIISSYQAKASISHQSKAIASLVLGRHFFVRSIEGSRLISLNHTYNSTAEWIARRLEEPMMS